MSLKAILTGSFIFLLIYALAVMLTLLQWALLLFSLSPLLLLFMAYRILKDPKPHSGATFDEKFYEDLDYTRNS